MVLEAVMYTVVPIPSKVTPIAAPVNPRPQADNMRTISPDAHIIPETH